MVPAFLVPKWGQSCPEKVGTVGPFSPHAGRKLPEGSLVGRDF